MNNILNLPNLISILRIFLTPMLIITMMKDSRLALIIFTLAAITDYYDGYFARKLNVVSSYGIFLDPLADKILVITTFTAFYLYNAISLWMLLIIILRDLSITLMRMFFALRGKVLKTSNFGKWKTALQLALIYLILGVMAFHKLTLNNLAGLFELYPSLMFLTYGVVFITLISGLDYLIKNFKSVYE